MFRVYHLLLIIGLLTTVQTTSAVTLVGFGSAKDSDNAKRIAYTDLLDQLQTELTHYKCSQAPSRTEKPNPPYHCLKSNNRFPWPLEPTFQLTHQAEGEGKAENEQYTAEATLNKKTIAALDSKISALYDTLDQSIIRRIDKKRLPYKKSDLDRYKKIGALWQTTKALNDYYDLYALFGLAFPVPYKTQWFEHAARHLTSNAQPVDSIETLATAVMNNSSGVKSAFLHAPKPLNTVEMTPLSLEIRHALAHAYQQAFPSGVLRVRGIKMVSHADTPCVDSRLNIETHCNPPSNTITTQSMPENMVEPTTEGDQRVLLSHYQINKRAIIFTFYLQDMAGLHSPSSYRLKKSKIKTRFEPLNAQFDQALHQPILAKQRFRTSITTSLGEQQILLTEKEQLELKIKMTEPGYYYLIGHIIREDKQFSYLIQLNAPSAPKPQFISTLSESQTNRYISLGHFEIHPPYGVEHVQIIASTFNPESTLPKVTYSESLGGYWVIEKSDKQINRALATTRGQQRYCRPTRGQSRHCRAHVATAMTETPTAGSKPTQQAEHEAAVSYTTMKAL